MKATNYWKQFAHTGRIEDYLSYKTYKCGAADPERGREAEEKGAGARPYAGIYMCDRNDTETNARGGI